MRTTEQIMNAIYAGRGASIKLREKVIDDCETVWTAVAANVTPAADDTPGFYMLGDYGAQIALGNSAAGIQAYSAGQCANEDLTTSALAEGLAWTHIKFWIYVDLGGEIGDPGIAAGDFRIGVSNAADASGTEYYADIPAIVQRTWTRVILATTAEMRANVNSLSSIHLYKTAATPDDCNIRLDDFRLCRYEVSGDEEITLPSTCTLGNDPPIGGLTGTQPVPEVFLFPWQVVKAVFWNLPVDVEAQWWRTAAIGILSDSDEEMGISPIVSGLPMVEVERPATMVAISPASDLADLAADEAIQVEVLG